MTFISGEAVKIGHMFIAEQIRRMCSRMKIATLSKLDYSMPKHPIHRTLTSDSHNGHSQNHELETATITRASTGAPGAGEQPVPHTHVSGWQATLGSEG